MSSKITTLDQFPDELIQEILEYLYINNPNPEDISPLNNTIKQVTVCNKRFRQIALPVLYRTVHISTMDQLDGFLLQVISKPQYSQFVRRLRVDENRGRYLGSKYNNWNLFREEAIRCNLEKIFGPKLNLEEGNDDVRACLLVHLLPQLEELSVNPFQSSALSTYHVYIADMMEQRLLSTKLRVWERGDQKLDDEELRVVQLVPTVSPVGQTLEPVTLDVCSVKCGEHRTFPVERKSG
ncbi:hypothetical protein CPB86DRAFT_812689 [Serendipita vermifera]|nr:hypothetical protein CPB86DRAFT_812689 [Serendipita vermifera]